MKVHELSEAENGATREVAVGDRVVLALGESRTSGFSWSLADCDQTVCRLVSDTFEPPADSKGGGKAGGSGRHRWTFEVVGAGKAVLSLSYRRSWKADGDAADTFKATMVATAA